jgi:hypothetical protein
MYARYQGETVNGVVGWGDLDSDRWNLGDLNKILTRHLLLTF